MRGANVVNNTEIDVTGNSILSPKDSLFDVQTAEWRSLNTFVSKAINGPTDDRKMAESLKVITEMTNLHCSDLTAVYKVMGDLCKHWRDVIFPDTIGLAREIKEYADYANIHYDAINKLMSTLQDQDTVTQKVQNEFGDIVAGLTKKITDYHNRAVRVVVSVQAFASNLTRDQATLTRLNNNFDPFCGSNGSTQAQINKLTQKIADLNSELSSLREKYNHEVTVAATTPTYAWVGLPGLAAAGIVAGIYGDRAVRTQADISKTEESIKQAKEEQGKHEKLYKGLESVQNSIKNVNSDLDAALPTVQHVQNIWSALRDELSALIQFIQQDVSQILDTGANEAVNIAISKWQQLGNHVESYQYNVCVNPESLSRAADDHSATFFALPKGFEERARITMSSDNQLKK